MAREQFNNEWEDPKKKRDKKQPMNPGKESPYSKYPPHKGAPNPGDKPKPKNPEKPKPTPKNPYNHMERHDSSMTNKRNFTKNPENPKGTEKPKPKGYPTDDLFKKMGEQKASVKIEKLKKKTTESVLKEKMEAKEKLKKKSPASRARPMLPKTKKKKKK